MDLSVEKIEGSRLPEKTVKGEWYSVVEGMTVYRAYIMEQGADVSEIDGFEYLPVDEDVKRKVVEAIEKHNS